MAFGYTIDVSVLSLGAVAVDALSPGNVTNTADTVFANTNWTVASTKYIAATSVANSIFKSVDSARDVEITTWTRDGMIYLRVVGGKAVYFHFNLETTYSTLTIGIVTGLNESGVMTFDGTYTALYRNVDLEGTVAGYVKSGDTANQKFRVGVNGLDIYADFSPDAGSSWTPVCRFREYRHVAAGAVWMKGNTGYGFRSIETVAPVANVILSDPANNQIHMTDFRVRSVTGIGSITGSTLTLNDPMDVAVGDSLLIPVGYEAGAGMRGTTGVGGVWPSLSYATLVAMNADVSQTVNRLAWRRDTGVIYQWDGVAWAPYAFGLQTYYLHRAVPVAYQGLVTAISLDNLTLTMDTAAVVSATSAPVFLDNLPMLHYVVGRQSQMPDMIGDLTAITPDNLVVELPAGTLAIGGTLAIVEHAGIELRGQGQDGTELYTPPGVRGAQITFGLCANAICRDLTLKSNFAPNGFGLLAPAFYHTLLYSHLAADGTLVCVRNTDESGTTEFGNTQGYIPEGGINFINASNGSRVYDCTVREVAMGAIRASFQTDVWVYRVAAIRETALQAYTQWQFEFDTCVNSGAVDCSYDSDYLTAAWEFFKGGEDCQFLRCTSRNGIYSLNATSGWEVVDCTMTVTANSQAVSTDADFPDPAFSRHNPILNCATNTGGGDPFPTGAITNFQMTFTGYINADNDEMIGIIVNDANEHGAYTDVQITGGFYHGLDYLAPSVINGPQGINSTGAGTVISCFTVTGQPKPGQSNIAISSGSVSYSRAEVIAAGVGVTTIGNGLPSDPQSIVCTGTIHASGQTVYINFVP